MKKYLYLVLLVIAFTSFANHSNAGELNNTTTEETSVQEKIEHKMFKGMHKSKKINKKHKKHKKYKSEAVYIYSSQIMQCQMEDLANNYQDILSEIASSAITQDARKLLSRQAEESYNLAVKQLREKMDLRAKQACERMSYRCELLKDQQNRNILRDIDKLLY